MKTVAIAQARMGSTRFKGKVLMPLGKCPVLSWTIRALEHASGIDQIVLATSTLPADDVIAEWCNTNGVECFRGSESDVLDRFYLCAQQYHADIILRLTCDCPLLDPAVISEVVRLQKMTGAQYASNIDPPSYPDGLDVQCFTFQALEAAWRESNRPSDRDCVPEFIVRNRSRFPAANLVCPLPGLASERWVLDTADDFKFCQAIVERLTKDGPLSYLDILSILDKEPELRKLNAVNTRNERFYEGLATEPLPTRTFERSQRVFARATKTIPFGAQTFSKSYLQYPPGRAPLYCSHADGAYLFDIDGNRYVDLVNAILPVVLGYRDPDVDDAIRGQLNAGISFSLATELETELSELLVKHIPCAEMVKFGKSGTDVTTAAIRLARAYTGRDNVVLSGYHGWADWSMSATDRDLGIPICIQWNTKKVEYGNREDFGRWINKDTAAVIVEPEHDSDFLACLRYRCDLLGIVLIFDEVITGFRWSMGGAQKLYGITPDLATFGKAMANGMPISALVGKRDIMMKMQPPDNIFYSGTMFGETLSIAAAVATINKLEREDVIGHLWTTGDKIAAAVDSLIEKYNLPTIIKLSGMPPRKVVNFYDHPNATKEQIKTLWMQEMLQGGVLIINSHNVSNSIRAPEIKRIVSAYDRALGQVAEAIQHNDIKNRIGEQVASVAPLRKAQ